MKILKNTVFLSLVITILASSILSAQNKYIDKKGKVAFEASEKLFEEVKAITESATAILDTETNQIASLALVKGFRFKNSLMQEHFNENYIESDTYPKATFKGKLIDFDSSKLSESPSQVAVIGKLKLHGKEKDIRTDVSVYKVENSIMMEGTFKVKPEDFDIGIPKIVRNKIAKEVLVQINFKLIQK
nr:YceI family protein [Allomuricauda sp.]